MLDPASTATKPPRKLGVPGLSLWQSIQREYVISDAAGIELLMQACGAADRIARLGERIDRDGEVIETEHGPRPNPLLREELSQRRFVCRTLERLGLNLEAVRPVGRPTSWAKRQEHRDGDH